MKRATRFLSILLTLCMVLGTLPMSALAAGSLPFTDVRITDWFYDSVEYVYDNDMMNGTGGGKFSPDATTTRGMIVTILHRLEGEPFAYGGQFSDVEAGAYYEYAVAWAADLNIVGGYGNGKFGPEDPITREQLASILYRYAQYKDMNVSAGEDTNILSYNDAFEISDYAYPALQWACAEGLINGVNGNLMPQGNATRAQVAAILTRFCNVGSGGILLPGFIFGRDDEEDEEDDDGIYTVTFNSNGGSAVEPQEVEKGGYVIYPGSPHRENYYFAGWYDSKNDIEQFKFYETTINNDTELVAKWIDAIDASDTDNDGLTNPIESFLGTDCNETDTDGDGLNDYVELVALGLDPLKVDSDGNGIKDGDEDIDSDGLTNLEEIRNGTNPAWADTDMDGLTDKEEFAYDTNPLNKDTDGDGVSDGKEVELGTNPLLAQVTFQVNAEAKEDDTVKASVEIELSGKQVETLSVVAYNNDTFFPETMPGYMGKAYDFNVEGTFDCAVIRFEFDPAMLKDGSDPTIFYFNEEDQELERLPTTINGNVASTEVTHFSKYILIDRTIYEDSFTWVDVWDSEHNYTEVEVVFVIDDSGSMNWNDPNYNRLSVARTLVDNLPANSKIGLVRFDGGYPKTEALTPTLTTDREAVKNFLTRTYFYSPGGTDMYNGINKAFPLFESTEETTLKMMIVLSDGETEDTHLHNSVIATANSNNIRIYTVGLGNSTSYFNRYMKPLATNTGAVFYLASNAAQLADIYKDISEKIDLEADTDDDGIPDYYEDNMIIFSGVSLTLDKNNPDTDGDGIPDGEEVVITIGPEIDGKVKVTGKLVMGNPTNRDSDNDGIVDNEDTAPFEKGLSGGIIGKLNLVTCYGDGWTSGHTYFVYESYINDSIDFSGLVNGWSKKEKTKNWTSDNLHRDTTPLTDYRINCNEFVAIGNGALGGGESSGLWDGVSAEDSAGDANGVNYNMETAKFVSAGRPTGAGVAFSYLSNTYIYEDITEETLKKLIEYLSREDVNYWSATHNCAYVAANGWNHISSTRVSAYGLDGWHLFATPSALRDNLRKISGHNEDFQMSTAFK